jgi:hypothetical protein
MDIRLSEVHKFYQACVLGATGWEVAGSRPISHLNFALFVLRIQSDRTKYIYAIWHTEGLRLSESRPQNISGNWLRKEGGAAWAVTVTEHTTETPGQWSTRVDATESVALLRDIAAGRHAPMLAGFRFEDEETDRVYRFVPALRPGDLRTLRACLRKLLPA